MIRLNLNPGSRVGVLNYIFILSFEYSILSRQLVLRCCADSQSNKHCEILVSCSDKERNCI